MAAKKKMEGSKLLIKASKVAFLPDLKSYGSFSKGEQKINNLYENCDFKGEVDLE